MSHPPRVRHLAAGQRTIPPMNTRAFLFLGLVACSGGDDKSEPTSTGHTGAIPLHSTPTTDTEPTGACGPPIDYDLTLTGLVQGASGEPGADTTLEVEDRGWTPGLILGTATTDAYGAFTMTLTDVTSVEDCWGTLLNYVLIGERDAFGGPEAGELGINTPLYNAIQDGTLLADLGALPFTLEEVK
jgi:hypothetical protein